MPSLVALDLPAGWDLGPRSNCLRPSVCLLMSQFPMRCSCSLSARNCKFLTGRTGARALLPGSQWVEPGLLPTFWPGGQETVTGRHLFDWADRELRLSQASSCLARRSGSCLRNRAQGAVGRAPDSQRGAVSDLFARWPGRQGTMCLTDHLFNVRNGEDGATRAVTGPGDVP